MRHGREELVWVVQRLPPWLTSFTMALVFLIAWTRPELLAWELTRDLERLLFAEVGIVLVAVLLLPHRATPAEEPWLLASILTLGLALALLVSTIVGLLVTAHLIARVGLTWQEGERTEARVTRFHVSLVALCLAWFAVGLIRVDETSWASTPVPRDLWWDLPSPGGARLVHHAVPSFGLVYFCLMTAVEVAKPLSRQVVGLLNESTPA